MVAGKPVAPMQGQLIPMAVPLGAPRQQGGIPPPHTLHIPATGPSASTLPGVSDIDTSTPVDRVSSPKSHKQVELCNCVVSKT